ncbi:reprolysin-like metallopeptidase [Flavobacterium sp. '19STA2R22 D10 B1']|uniref:zinc-dependent metalloprotease n=1 Tax=Flavobacterium aerium TaxID=3037261 RepID=UPI00278BBF91|nr:zinc-dependent metalloprotease family protein [Flavobacterium sp. '19STA2R22 D10 B1']
MHADLAARYPGIKSYVGLGIEDPTARIRFSVTVFGLHTMTLSGKHGAHYIDPYTKDLNNYIVYDKKNVLSSRNFTCNVEDSADDMVEELSGDVEALRASNGLFKTYRLAMACTVEYAAFQLTAAGTPATATLAEKKAVVLAAMNVTMTRVNGLYEKDMSLTMVLVPNNDSVIFIDADDFTNSPAMINEIQPIMDAAIGAANYDIGHGVCTTDSGIAQLNSPCSANKARGITGQAAPVGDPFDIDYVAHEMGHQFGATHTQNNSCNRTNATAVEPGSGSTIMAYAGICAPNVQAHSDAHFNGVSIGQMEAFVNAAGNCAVAVPNNNAAPVAEAGQNYTIPNGTAFILKGSATDADNDSLTYCWEQTNNQVSTQPPLQSATTGPNFRSNPPTDSPNRYMPALASVLAGNLAPTWEVVPSVARTMNFTLTVRDNKTPNGGQTHRDNMTVTFASVGPFKVTSPSVENETWTQGDTKTITWDVAGTTANNINTANVNILLSTDGGLTFPTVLAANTPNDGTEAITIPTVVSAPYCRIKVEAVGNIFYTISKNIAIGYTVVTETVCNTYTATPTVNVIQDQNPLAYQAWSINVPDNVVISDLNVSVDITHPKISELQMAVVKPGTNAIGPLLFQQTCSTTANMKTKFDDSGVAFSCAGANGNNTYKPQEALNAFNGGNSQGTWRLVIADVVAGNNGTLNSFAFEICSTTTTATLGRDEFSFKDFALYPNPNRGNFTVQFNTTSTDGIGIRVHDMRGRVILENKYNTTGMFNQNIQLDNVQSGIYMVTVQDGARKIVKKIVVE